MKKISVAVVTLCILVACGSVQAKPMEEKVDALSARISALEKTNIEKGSNIASAISRAEAIQTEFAAVKGAVDSNSHLISATNNQLQNLYGGLERRIQNLEDQIQMLKAVQRDGI